MKLIELLTGLDDDLSITIQQNGGIINQYDKLSSIPFYLMGCDVLYYSPSDQTDMYVQVVYHDRRTITLSDLLVVVNQYTLIAIHQDADVPDKHYFNIDDIPEHLHKRKVLALWISSLYLHVLLEADNEEH